MSDADSDTGGFPEVEAEAAGEGVRSDEVSQEDSDEDSEEDGTGSEASDEWSVVSSA